MPELPEVETIVSDLNQKIKGDEIAHFWSEWPKALKNTTLLKFKKDIENRKILGARRIGKNIFLELSGGKTLHIHLRMTGHLLVKKQESVNSEQEKKNKSFFNDRVNQYIRHKFFLKSSKKLKANKLKSCDKVLEFSDVRKFATLHLLETNSLAKYLAEKKIGLDALDAKFTLTKFKALLAQKPKMPLGLFLLDQSLLAGIGNIYRSEILFSAGISPKRKNETLKKTEQEKIFLATKKILHLAIKLRGTSDSDYRDTSGAPGNFQKVLKVYRKDKTPCPKCKKPLL